VARRKSFTLIELMAALVLFLVMSIIVMRVFSAAHQVVSKAKANSQMYRQARAILDIIESDLAKAYVDQTGRFFYCSDRNIPGVIRDGGSGTYDGPAALGGDDTWYDGTTAGWPGPTSFPPGKILVLPGPDGTINTGTGADDFLDVVPPFIPPGFNLSVPGTAVPPSAASPLRLLMFATTNADHRLIHPALARAGAPPAYQVMYYLRDDGALIRLVENFEVPEWVAAQAPPDGPPPCLPGEMDGDRSFWVQNNLATFAPSYGAGWRTGFQTPAEAFENCPRYQTCQVTGDSSAGELANPLYSPTDVTDYYLLSTNVRSINFRFFDPVANRWWRNWNWGAFEMPRLPYAVHVTVEMESDNERWTAAFSTLVHIGR